jgi:hypothetical protein
MAHCSAKIVDFAVNPDFGRLKFGAERSVTLNDFAAPWPQFLGHA